MLFSANSIAVGKPVKEGVGSVVRVVFCQCLHTTGVEGIGGSLLAVGGFKFELVSDTHQLDSFLGHLGLQILPIVSALCIVILFVYGTHNVGGSEPPFAVLFVPNGTDLAVFIESDGFFVHYRCFSSRCRNPKGINSISFYSFCCASRRSKSLWNSRSCKTRYFSNSLSAKLLAISADTRPLSCRTSSSLSTCVAHWRKWVARSELSHRLAMRSRGNPLYYCGSVFLS